MRRFRCSRPITLALAQDVIRTETSVFDYGCGHGGDLRYLQSRGVQASGWDPHHAPEATKTRAAVVTLGYVLNVIEDAKERRETLLRAYELAEDVLVVAVRVDRSLDDASEYGDGVITNRGTFQKLYTHEEFREYVEGVLGRRMHTAALGVGYVFRSDEQEQRFVASEAFSRRLEYRADLISQFEKDEIANAYVELANQLGRTPLPEEFPQYQELLEKFGSRNRIDRLLLGRLDRESYEGSRAERRNDILVYLAMLKLQRLAPPPMRALPRSVQNDIKAIWGSFEKAVKEGTEFLFTLGRPDAVRMACSASTVGKLLPGDLYVHTSAEDELPALVRLVVWAAKRIVGELNYELLKVALDGRAVAFLSYPGFDEVAHPALRRSVRVYLPKASYEVRDYSQTANPPILHRKDRLVSESYPLYREFRTLTEQEEKYGLLSGGDIGFKTGWEALLSSYRLAVEGHRVKSLL